MKICAVNFSYSKDSMGLRGLQLLDQCYPFDALLNVADYNIPVCDSNKADGVVIPEVDRMFDDMCGYDAYVFSVAEYSGAYCVGFKNIMDWFVVKTFYNSTLGQDYPFTNKPIATVTFTPTTTNGDRHFDMTAKLLDKLGGTVVVSHVFQDGWNTVRPDNSNLFADDYKYIREQLQTVEPKYFETYNNAHKDAQRWISVYENWNNEWKHS